MDKCKEAGRIAKEVIAKAQPNGEIPLWIQRNTGMTFSPPRKNDTRERDTWIVQVDIFKKQELKPGYSWERGTDGSKRLTKIDPETGKKWVVISDDEYDESDRVVLFEVEVNVASGEATMKKSTVLSELNPETFELYFEDDP